MKFPQIRNDFEEIIRIIIWWEIRRIPYNIIMLFFGYLSFFVSYVTIPLVYGLIAIYLNVFYCIGWIIEISCVKSMNDERIKLKYPRYALKIYLVLSFIFIFGYAYGLFDLPI